MRGSRFVGWPIAHPLVAILIAGIALLIGVFGLTRARIDTTITSLFPKNDPAAIALTRVLEEFPAADELLLLVTAPEAGPDRLAGFAKRLETSLRTSPEASPMVADVIYRVDEQTSEFIQYVLVPAGMYYLDEPAFEAAKARLTREGMSRQIRQGEAMIAAPGPALGALSQVLLQDPLRLREFLTQKLLESAPVKPAGGSDLQLSRDGRSLLIRIRGTSKSIDLEFARNFTRVVTETANAVNTGELELDLGGSYAIAARSEAEIKADSISSVLSSVVLLQLLFIVAYRRPFRLFILAFLPVAVGITYGLGIYAAVAPGLSPITAVIGGTLAGMGIDYSIHYLSHFQSARERGLSLHEALLETSNALLLPQVAAWLTSIMGFVAIAWSSVTALREFAIVGTLGLTGALVASLFILPPMIIFFGGEQTTAKRGARLNLHGFVRTLSARGKPVVVATLLVTGAMVAILAVPGERIGLEQDLTVVHPRPNPPLDAQRKIAERLGQAGDSLILHLSAASPEALVQLAHDVDAALKSPESKQAGVASAYGLDDLLPSPQRVAARMPEATAEYAGRVVSDFRATVADSIFSPDAYEPYAKFLSHLVSMRDPPKLDALRAYPRLASTVLGQSTMNGTATDRFEAITMAFVGTTIDTRADRERSIDAVRKAVAHLPGATLTGLSVLGLDAERAVQRDLPTMLIWSSAMIVGYLLFQYRSVTNALLAVAPTVISLVCLAGVMRLTGMKFNLVNLVSIPLLIGIVVDYAVFIIGRGQRVEHEQRVSDVASSSHAITVSAVATIIGYGSQLWTSIPAIRSLGVTMAIGMTAGLAATLFLLAPIVLRQKK